MQEILYKDCIFNAYQRHIPAVANSIDVDAIYQAFESSGCTANKRQTKNEPKDENRVGMECIDEFHWRHPDDMKRSESRIRCEYINLYSGQFHLTSA